MPSDIRIHESLDFVSIRTINGCTNERQQTIEHVFDITNCSLIQLLYHLEILSSKILPLSTNNGIQQSSKIFRQDFIKQFGIEFLFQLLQSLNNFIHDDYHYSLCQEMTILILQLIQFLVCGINQHDEFLSSSISMQISPSSSSLHTPNDSLNNSIDMEFQGTIEQLKFEEFIDEIKQLIFLCWSAAAGNIKLHGQNIIIKEQIKLDRHTLLQQINANIFSRNNSQNSLSNESSIHNHVQFGICVKKNSILPLDSEIAEKIIEIIRFCFEKRPEFIGKLTRINVQE
jgi:hypothetical protein